MYSIWQRQGGTIAFVYIKSAGFILALFILLFCFGAHAIAASTEKNISSAPVNASPLPFYNSGTGKQVITEVVNGGKALTNEQKREHIAASEGKTQSAMALSGGDTNFNGGEIFVNNVGLGQSVPHVNVNDGSLSYTYSITLPPGREEMTPDLKLDYNSNDHDNTSPFGFGWSVSIPYITRINRTGLNTVYDTDLYNSSLDGELVKVSTTTYKAKVENGSFRTYTFDNNT